MSYKLKCLPGICSIKMIYRVWRMDDPRGEIREEISSPKKC